MAWLLLGAFSSAGAQAARAASASTCPGAYLQPPQASAAVVQQATLCLLNRIRRSHHLAALRTSGELASVAHRQVQRMLSSDYFSDTSPSGQTPLAMVAVTRYPVYANRVTIGENIAWGTGVDSTPASIVAAWMASPPHRANILGRLYLEAGVSILAAVPSVVEPTMPGATYAVEFGQRLY